MMETTPQWTHAFGQGARKTAKLRFEAGVAPRLEVRSAPLGGQLARCHLPEPAPRVEATPEGLSVDYHGFFRWFFLGRYPPGIIELTDALPWTILVDGGVAKATFSLRTLHLQEIQVDGGIADVELRLGTPDRVVPVHVNGGAARIRITRPPGVGVRLRISGGATDVAVDEQAFGAVGGGLTLTSRDWDPKGAGYDIRVSGGATRFSIQPEAVA